MGWPNWRRSLRVAQRGLVGALREAHRQRRDADAAGVEHLQRLDEALALLAEQLRRRARGILEDDLARVARAHAELVLLLARHAGPGVPRSMTNAEMPLLAPSARR